ncbi:MAG: histidine phosphatase family protein [Anaerolineales bacterium]
MTPQKNEKPVFDIIFLRHGESIGNAEGRWQGQFDYPLTDKGRAQARALADRWLAEKRTFDTILASTLGRARETADILAAALGGVVEYDRLWMERNIGILAGLTDAEVRQHFPEPDFVTPFDAVGLDGEGDWELYLRAGRALHSLLRRRPGRYLVVSHGGLLNQVLHAIVGITPQANSSGLHFHFHNGAFAHLLYYPDVHRWHINSLNDCRHWTEESEE